MKTIFFHLFILFATHVSLAQFQPTPTTVESLKLNSSPAYIILGVEPENIQRPSSPQQFVAGIQDAMVNGKLKPNLAMEITPFYISKPEGDKASRFNAYEFLFNADNSLGNTIRKTLSISFATSESDTVHFGKLKPGMGLGLGLRCVLIDVKPKSETINNLKKWMESEVRRAFFSTLRMSRLRPTSQKEFIDSLISITNSFKRSALTNQSFNGLPYSYASKIIDDINTELTSKVVANTFSSRDMSLFQNELQAEVDKENLSQTIYLSKINNAVIPFTKEGFMLEFGAGFASVLQENKFNDWKSAKVAVWLTPSWRWNQSKDDKVISLVDIMGVFRYTANNKRDSIDLADYFDVGGKGQFTRNNWSGSLEYIYRLASKVPDTVKSKNTYRLALGIDYKITTALTFKFTFGTNFDGNTRTYTKPKEMFAIGGLNLGIFNPFKKDNN